MELTNESQRLLAVKMISGIEDVEVPEIGVGDMLIKMHSLHGSVRYRHS